jgi:hypothetical protein
MANPKEAINPVLKAVAVELAVVSIGMGFIPET